MTYYWPAEREHFGYAVKHPQSSGLVRVDPRLARINIFVPTVAGFEVELPHALSVRPGWSFTIFNGGTVDLDVIRSSQDLSSGIIITLQSGWKANVYLAGVDDNDDGLWYASLSTGNSGPLL